MIGLRTPFRWVTLGFVAVWIVLFFVAWVFNAVGDLQDLKASRDEQTEQLKSLETRSECQTDQMRTALESRLSRQEFNTAKETLAGKAGLAATDKRLADAELKLAENTRATNDALAAQRQLTARVEAVQRLVDRPPPLPSGDSAPEMRILVPAAATTRPGTLHVENTTDADQCVKINGLLVWVSPHKSRDIPVPSGSVPCELSPNEAVKIVSIDASNNYCCRVQIVATNLPTLRPLARNP